MVLWILNTSCVTLAVEILGICYIICKYFGEIDHVIMEQVCIIEKHWLFWWYIIVFGNKQVWCDFEDSCTVVWLYKFVLMSRDSYQNEHWLYHDYTSSSQHWRAQYLTLRVKDKMADIFKCMKEMLNIFIKISLASNFDWFTYDWWQISIGYLWYNLYNTALL